MEKIRKCLSEKTILSISNVVTIIADIISIIGLILIIRYFFQLKGEYGGGLSAWFDRYGEARRKGYAETHLQTIVFWLHAGAFLCLYIRAYSMGIRNKISGIIAVVSGVISIPSIFLNNIVISSLLFGASLIALVITFIFMWLDFDKNDIKSYISYWLISFIVTCVILPLVNYLLAFLLGIIILGIIIFILSLCFGGETDEIVVYNKETGEANTYVRKD